MAGSFGTGDEAALWRRWHALAGDATEGTPDPDAMLLADYAEGRLDEAAAEPVEAWLLAHPEALDDVRAAREAAELPAAALPAAALSRAMALVAASDGNIVPFRRSARPPAWRIAVTWGGLAASIAAASLMGFALGSDAYSSLSGRAAPSGIELLDPPGGLFTSFGEDQST